MGDFMELDYRLQRQRTNEIVLEQMMTWIMDGTLSMGQKINTEQIAKQLGVSRMPVREAAASLEKMGLAESLPYVGYRLITINASVIDDLYLIRRALEPMAAYYACINMTEEGLKELKHIMDLQEFYFSKWDVEHLRQEDDKFHDVICELSQRTVLRDTLVPLHRKTRRYRKTAMQDKNRAAKSLQEHHEILAAFQERDSEKVKNAMNSHISRVKKYMTEGK